MVHTSKWAEQWKACGGVRQSPIDIITCLGSLHAGVWSPVLKAQGSDGRRWQLMPTAPVRAF
ncbi:hypothetical protein PR002_g31809 [Phytophthora rubi]|uniref:Uncharacterized protein n=1 Tax=Phytophthora rubi TaxID=129364 RepID=A0A6A3GEV0_9STRA|nr:hypothetical protein PR002_g31809 [Phytophthora rubi]